MKLRHLLLGRKVMTNLNSILKSRDITLPTKVHLVKAMVFPVVMYGCELDYKERWAWKNWCFWTVENSKRDGNTRPPNCLLRNLYTGQEATVRTGHRTDWFQIGKGVHQGCILSPCLFNLYAEFIMRLTREVSITSNVQMIPPLWQKVKRN